MNKHDHKTKAVEFLNEATNEIYETHTEISSKLEEMLDDDLVIQWTKFDEDNPATWPKDAHGRNQVLGLTVWSKGSQHRYGSMGRGESKDASFFEAFYGRYEHAVIEGEPKVVFFLDHGGEDEDESDDWIEPPLFWTFIADPQRLGIV